MRLKKWNTHFSIDPRGRPTVTAGSDHYIRPYVRPHFSKSCKTKQISSENSDRYRRAVGLAEWIIKWH